MECLTITMRRSPRPTICYRIEVMVKTTNKPSIWLRLCIPAALVIAWLGITGVGGPYFGKISDVATNDLSTFLPESAEATKANEQIEKFRDGKSIPAVIVFEKSSALGDTEQTKLAQLQKEFATVSQVDGDISPPVYSQDKKAALIVVPVARDSELKKVMADMRARIDTSSLGLTYKIGGPASFSQELQKAFSGIDVTLLAVALSTVFIILLVVYRSPFLPIIVLTTATAALSAAIFVVWHLANADILQLNGQVQGILFILVIGATTDYSLLYLARLREELHNHRTTYDATKAALKGSYESIIAAGGTVTLGLMCLLLSDLGSNKALGPVGGVGIALAIIASLTFLPALLLLIGRGVFWPRRPNYEPSRTVDYLVHYRWWARIGRLISRHPRRIWVGVTVLLLVACVGTVQLRADGVPQSELVLGTSEARDAQAIIDAHFASGSGSPAYVVAPEQDRDRIVAQLDNDAGIAAVNIAADRAPSGAVPIGKARVELEQKIMTSVEQDRQQKLTQLKASIQASMTHAPQAVIDQAVAAASANIPETAVIAKQAYPFKNATPKVRNGEVLIEATLKDSVDSTAARETIIRIRDDLKKINDHSLVGGMTAIQYDTNQASKNDRMIIIPVVLAVITIILGLLLRSIIAPIILLITTLISFGATLGISSVLFNDILHFPGADPSVILFGFIFLVALGIDYNIFLMTRVREETIKSNIHDGTLKALVVTGGVITSAGIVLAATFAALGIIPILFLVQLAFVVAFGVLLDTIIVRSLLVPTLTLEIGRYMWWPSKLSHRKRTK